jgi:putative FmdB family regulatory protein
MVKYNMPIYEYECPECTKKITVTRGISDSDPGYSCDTCKKDLNRVYSLGAVTFNGKGFYSTDK